jgi:hypothetical protein
MELEPMDFFTFRDKVSQKMFGYVPTARKYPGNEQMRSSIQQHTEEQVPAEVVAVEENNDSSGGRQ